MKVLLVNGSAHKYGCTFTALEEIAKTLEENNINRPELEGREMKNFIR